MNGYEVIEIDLGHEVDNQICVSTPTVKELYLLEKDIETVVTKQQFEKMKYIVKEN